MRPLMEPLESRLLMSVVTKATLATDQSAITTNAAAVTAAAKVLAAQTKLELAAITADLKALPKSNAPLLAAVKLDVSHVATLTTADGGLIVKGSGTLAKKAVATGMLELQSFSSKNVAALTTDAATLNGILVSPLGKLNLDLNGPLVSDLGVLAAANPSAAQLAADIAALNASYAADSNALTAAAGTYGTSLTGLATDITTISSSPPNILFSYTGTATEQGGPKAGKSGPVSLTITVEASDGSWTGTVTAPNGAGIPVAHLAQGSVSTTGAFTGTFSTSVGAATLLTGQVNGNAIKGVVNGANGSGTFSVTHK